MNLFFASGGQSVGISASASGLPKDIQDWFPLELTGWISLQSKGLSRVFSKSTVQMHQFFVLDHMIVLFLIFWGMSVVVFLGGCTRLHSHPQRTKVRFSPESVSSLTLISCLDRSHSDRCAIISHLWFWFAFPWWQLMLNIFSCTFWPSVCLRESVYSDCLPNFNLTVWFSCLWYWVVSVLYLVCLLTPDQVYDLRIFPSFRLVVFFILLMVSFADHLPLLKSSEKEVCSEVWACKVKVTLWLP